MRRREFIALVGGAAVVWPLMARAQQSDRMRRIGVLQILADDDPESVARHAAFEKALQALGWTVGRNVQIDYRLGGVDADRILQVLANLVGNGVKFTPRGGTVRVSAELRDGMIAVDVRDTGSGIAASDLPRVFDRFWQSADAARLGNGLGLAICKAIIELSRGTIIASSTFGIGTTMTFTVPTARPGPGCASGRD